MTGAQPLSTDNSSGDFVDPTPAPAQPTFSLKFPRPAVPTIPLYEGWVVEKAAQLAPFEKEARNAWRRSVAHHDNDIVVDFIESVWRQLGEALGEDGAAQRLEARLRSDPAALIENFLAPLREGSDCAAYYRAWRVLNADFYGYLFRHGSVEIDLAAREFNPSTRAPTTRFFEVSCKYLQGQVAKRDAASGGSAIETESVESEDSSTRVGLSRLFAHRYAELLLEYDLFLRTAYQQYEGRDTRSLDQFLDTDVIDHVEAFLRFKYPGATQDREAGLARNLFLIRLYPAALEAGAVTSNTRVEAFMRANPTETPTPQYRAWCEHLVSLSTGSQSERFPEWARVGGAFFGFLSIRHEGKGAGAQLAAVRLDPAAEIGSYLESRGLKRDDALYVRERDILVREVVPWYVGPGADKTGSTNPALLALLRAGSAPSIPCHVNFCSDLLARYESEHTIHRSREMERLATTVGAFVESVWLRNREQLASDPVRFEQYLIANGREEVHAYLKGLREGTDRHAYIVAWRDLTGIFYGHLSSAGNEAATEVATLRLAPTPNTPTLPFYDSWSAQLNARAASVKPEPEAPSDNPADAGEVAVEEALREELSPEGEGGGQRREAGPRLLGKVTFEYLEFLWESEGKARAAKQSLDVVAEPAKAAELFSKIIREDHRPHIEAFVAAKGLQADDRVAKNISSMLLAGFVSWAQEEGHVRFDLERARFMESFDIEPPAQIFTALLGDIWKESSTSGVAAFRAGIAREYFEYLRDRSAGDRGPREKPDYKELVQVDTAKRISEMLRHIHDHEPARSLELIRTCLVQHILPFLERRLDFSAAGVADLATRVITAAPYVPAIIAYEDRVHSDPYPVDGTEMSARVLKNVDAYLSALWIKTERDAKYIGAAAATSDAKLRAAFQTSLTESARQSLDWYFKQLDASTSIQECAERRADIYGGLYGILFRCGQVKEDLFPERYALPPRVPSHALWNEWTELASALPDERALPRVVYVNQFLESLWTGKGRERLAALGAGATLDSPIASAIMIELLEEDPLAAISHFASSVAPEPFSRAHYEVTRILEEEFYPLAHKIGAIKFDIGLAVRAEAFEMSPQNEIFQSWIAEKTLIATEPRQKATETANARFVRDYLLHLWSTYEGGSLLPQPAPQGSADRLLHSFIARNCVSDINTFVDSRSGAGPYAPSRVRQVLLTEFLPWYQQKFHDLSIETARENFRREAKIPRSELYTEFWGNLYSLVHEPPSRLSETMAIEVGTITKDFFEFCAAEHAAELKRAENPSRVLEELILAPAGEAVREFFAARLEVVGQQEVFRQRAHLYEFFYHWAFEYSRVDWEPRAAALLPLIAAPRSPNLVAWSEHLSKESGDGSERTEDTGSLGIPETLYWRARAVALYADYIWRSEGQQRFDEQYVGRARTLTRKGEVLDALCIENFEERVAAYVETLPADQFKVRTRNVLLEHFYPFLHSQGVVEFDKARRDFMSGLELPHQIVGFDHYAAELFKSWQEREAAAAKAGTNLLPPEEGMSLGQARKKLLAVHDYITYAWDEVVVPKLTEKRDLSRISADVQQRALEEAIVKNPAALLERYIAHVQSTSSSRVTLVHNVLFDDFYPRLKAADLTKFDTRKYLFLPPTECPHTPLLRRVFDHLYDQVERYRNSSVTGDDRPGLSPAQATRIGSTTINFFEHVLREYCKPGEAAAAELDRLITEDPEDLCKEYLELIWEQGSEIRYYQLRSDLYNSLYPVLRKWGVTEFETERLAFPLRVANHPNCELLRNFWNYLYDRVNDKKSEHPIGVKAAQQYGRVVLDYVSYLIDEHSSGTGRLTPRALEDLMCRSPKNRLESFLATHAKSAKIDTVRSAIYQLYRWMHEEKLCTLDPASLRKRAAAGSDVGRKRERASSRDASPQRPAKAARVRVEPDREVRATRRGRSQGGSEPRRAAPSAAPGTRATSRLDPRRVPGRGREEEVLSRDELEELLQEVEPPLRGDRAERPAKKPPVAMANVSKKSAEGKGGDAARPENPTDPFMKRMLAAAKSIPTPPRPIKITSIRNDLITKLVANGVFTFDEVCNLEVWQVWPSEKALHVVKDGSISKDLLHHRLPKDLQRDAKKATALVQNFVDGFEAYASRLPTSDLARGWRRGHSSAKFFQRVNGGGLTADDEPVDGKPTDRNVMKLIEHRNAAITVLMRKHGMTMQQILDAQRRELEIKGDNAVLKVSDNFGETRKIELRRDRPDELAVFYWVIGVEQVSEIRGGWRMNHGGSPLFPGMNDERLFGHQDD